MGNDDLDSIPVKLRPPRPAPALPVSQKRPHAVSYPSASFGRPIMVIALITDDQAIDRVVDHLKLTFVAAMPQPSHVYEQVAPTAAEGSGSLWAFGR